MITSKIVKTAPKEDSQEKLFRLLESIDWKLWEMYNMMKDALPENKPATKRSSRKSSSDE